MEHSESVTELLTALCEARQDFPPIVRNREGFSKRGGQKYSYADLNAIVDATAPSLAKHGLTLMQFLEDVPELDRVAVQSYLFHTSGQFMKSVLTVAKLDDPQEFGIVTTYAKRYAQQAILDISTEPDTDGAGVAEEKPERGRRRDPIESPRQMKPQADPVPIVTSAVGEKPPSSGPRPKPTKDEVEKVLALLTEVYPDDDQRDRIIREVMQIPAPQPYNPTRLRFTMTGAQCQQFEDIAVREAKQQARQSDTGTDDDDVPLTPGPEPSDVPAAELSPQGEPTDSRETGASNLEAASHGVEPLSDTGAIDIDADDPPDFGLGNDELVNLDAMPPLKARAEKHGNRLLLRQILKDAEQPTMGIYYFAWVQVGPKTAKVSS